MSGDAAPTAFPAERPVVVISGPQMPLMLAVVAAAREWRAAVDDPDSPARIYATARASLTYAVDAYNRSLPAEPAP